MQRDQYDFVVIHQSCNQQTFHLLERLAAEVGPTLLITGTEFGPTRTESLTVLPAPPYDNTSYRSRLRTWLKYCAFALREVRKVKNARVTIATTNPPFAPFLGYWLERTRGMHLVIRVLDVYPDAILQSGLARGFFRIVPPLWELANRVSFGRASQVITLGDCMAERVSRFCPEIPIEIIPDWVNTDEITPLAKDQNWFAKEHGQVGCLTVLYSGNLGVTHDAEGLFFAISQLQNNPQIQFVFIGGGARREELIARTRTLSNCRVLPNQPIEVLPYSLTTADIAVVLLGDSGRGVSMPSKTYNMMATGAAVLGISSGDNDLARVIEKHQVGLNVDPADGPGIVAALQRFAQDPEFLAACRANSRKAAVETYSQKTCETALLKLLRAVRDAPV